MHTTFTLIGPDRTPWSEADLDTDADTVTRILAGQTSLYGMLHIEDEASDEVVDIVDDLDALIAGVCMVLIPDLVAGRAVNYLLSAHAETVTLTPNGDQIEIEGTDVDDASFDTQALLTSLVTCGARYVAFKEKVLGSGDRRVEKLNAALTRAHDALAG